MAVKDKTELKEESKVEETQEEVAESEAPKEADLNGEAGKMGVDNSLVGVIIRLFRSILFWEARI